MLVQNYVSTLRQTHSRRLIYPLKGLVIAKYLEDIVRDELFKGCWGNIIKPTYLQSITSFSFTEFNSIFAVNYGSDDTY